MILQALFIYLLLSFNLLSLQCRLSLLRTFYIFMSYQCFILYTSEYSGYTTLYK